MQKFLFRVAFACLVFVVLTAASIGLRAFNEAGENIFKLWPYDEGGPRLLAQHAIEKG